MSGHALPWSSALVTGGSSGIGLAATRLLLEHTGLRLVVVSRGAQEHPALRLLAAGHGTRLQCVAADLTDPRQIERLGADLAESAPPLDLVFHAAGVLHDADLAPEKSLRQLELAALQRSFAVNAFAPALLLRALLPTLRLGHRAIFASLSARVGSISDNRLGGWYSYRAAKAAQNQLLKTAAIELRRTAPQLAVVMLHPGTVDTPLSAPFQRDVAEGKRFAPADAAHRLLQLLASLGPDDSGRFVAWDGQDVPW